MSCSGRGGAITLVSAPLGRPWTNGSAKLVGELLEALGELARDRPVPPLRVFGRPGFSSPEAVAEVVVLDERRRLRNLSLSASLAADRSALGHHYFFAPHALAVAVAQAVAKTSGVPPLQTICSRPRDFRGSRQLCFGRKVVTLSRWTRDWLIADGVEADRLVVIPPPLAPIERPSASRRRRVRQQLGIDTDGQVLIFPGDAERGGGLRAVIEAIPWVRRDNERVVFVIACRDKSPEASTELQRARRRLEAAGALDAVRFAGVIDDFHAALAAADLCWLPSSTLYTKIDYPYALLEAMSLEVPVLVGATTQAAELVTSGGGRAVHPRASRALAATALSWLADDRKLTEQGRRARQRVEEICDPRMVAEAYLELFAEL